MAGNLEKMVEQARSEMKVDENIAQLVTRFEAFLKSPEGLGASASDRQRWSALQRS